MAMTATDYIYRRMLNPQRGSLCDTQGPQRKGCTMKELKLTNHDNRPPSGHDRDLRMPSIVDRQGSVAMDDADGMISISGRWWSFPGAQIDGDSWEGERRSDGKVWLRDSIGNMVEGTEVDNPEALAVVPLPSAAERRRREVMLARVMLVAIDIILAGDPLSLETARDLIRELRHCYPELVDEWTKCEDSLKRQ